MSLSPRPLFALFALAATLSAGEPAQANRRDPNVCATLAAHPAWARAAAVSAARWKTPASILLAILRQESNFRPARAPRAAYGAPSYAQAARRTWALYQHGAGRTDANPADFADAIDFVGWYISRADAGAPRADVAALYLAYSRGPAARGPASRTAQANAARVAAFAQTYQRELQACPLAQ